MHNPRSARLVETTAVLLFFVQAVRVLFSVLFGLIYDAIFSEAVALTTMGLIMLCVIVAFLTPLVTPRHGKRWLLLATAAVAALARIPLTINAPTVRLWSSVLIIGASGLYTVTLLRQRPRVFPTGLLLAFALDQFLRAAGSTFDVGLRSWWLPVQVVLSLATCAVAWLAFSRSRGDSPATERIGIGSGLAIGALLFLESSLLDFPNALARWAEVDYAIVAPLLMLVTLLAALSPARQVAFRLLRGPLGGLGLLFLALAGLAAGRTVGGAAGLTGMLVAQFLLLLVPFGLARSRRRERSGLALALGFLLFLVLSFGFAFTFTYPYTIPAFRDMGLPIALLATAIACLPALRFRSLKPETLRAEPTRLSSSQAQDEAWNLKPQLWPWLSTALAVLVTVAFAWPTAPDLKQEGPVRVGTYNIHYGYNTPWQFSLEAQARTIEGCGADIVVMQEVEGCRITSYGVDNALWLARRLHMQEVYGPALEGLSGIALLTRFPITEADTRLLTSHLEQTSIVHARVQVGDQPLDAYGVWLGLEPDERARQSEDALSIIGAISPAVLGGDFNSTPDSPTYARILAAGFDDPFIAGGLDPVPTDPAIQPAERIDFVWSRGLEPRDAQVLDSLASDHRMVVVELVLP